MLIGARDENGTANLFNCDEGKFPVYKKGEWHEADGTELLFCNENAEPFCQNIPNGESRVIDLEKSAIVHVQPKKTPYEELVEAADFVITAIANIGHDDIEFTSWPVNGAKLKSLKRALARVRQEGGV